MGQYGWKFEAVTPQGVVTPVAPAARGSLEYDGGRDVSKTLRDVVFLPNEWRKLNPVPDEIKLTMVYDDVEHPMGYFCASDAPQQHKVLLDPETNEVADLYTVGFGDRMGRLIRSNGAAQIIQGGFDPAQEAIDLLQFVKIPYGWENSASPAGDAIVWNGDVTLLSKVVQLSQLAGHRNPWMNNEGIIRSVVARTPHPLDPTIIDVENALNLEAGSVVITPLYLTAPNVVIVTGNSANLNAPVAGRWDAPSIYPNSFANRGYFYTQMVDRQGLRDNDHAAKVARAIGQKNSARILNFICEPTWLIDGPSILRYDDTLWVVTSYDIDLGPAGKMSVQGEELTESDMLQPEFPVDQFPIL